jgi:hypothetical protein
MNRIGRKCVPLHFLPSDGAIRTSRINFTLNHPVIPGKLTRKTIVNWHFILQKLFLRLFGFDRMVH